MPTLRDRASNLSFKLKESVLEGVARSVNEVYNWFNKVVVSQLQRDSYLRNTKLFAILVHVRDGPSSVFFLICVDVVSCWVFKPNSSSRSQGAHAPTWHLTVFHPTHTSRDLCNKLQAKGRDLENVWNEVFNLSIMWTGYTFKTEFLQSMDAGLMSEELTMPCGNSDVNLIQEAWCDERDGMNLFK